jgi:16S rRNA processing protein RimM
VTRLVTLGRIAGVFGVQGWLKVHSYTEPRENIVTFGEWIVSRDGEQRRIRLDGGRGHRGSVIAKLHGVDDRDQARAWIGAEIAVERAALPPLGPDEYYWADLEGLEVRNGQGESLGRVDHLLATGAHDVLVLRDARGGETLVPFVLDRIVRKVDLEAGVIVVDWEPGFQE